MGEGSEKNPGRAGSEDCMVMPHPGQTDLALTAGRSEETTAGGCGAGGGGEQRWRRKGIGEGLEVWAAAGW